MPRLREVSEPAGSLRAMWHARPTRRRRDSGRWRGPVRLVAMSGLAGVLLGGVVPAAAASTAPPSPSTAPTTPTPGGGGAAARTATRPAVEAPLVGSAGIDSSVQYWSPMASGALLSARPPAAPHAADTTTNATASAGGPAGGAPPDLLAAERLQLGWLDYEAVQPGETRDVRLADQPTPGATGTAGAAVVPLGPLDRAARVGLPATGQRAYVASLGSSSEAVLGLPVDVGDARVAWRQWTDIEPLFDTLRVQGRVGGAWRDIAPSTTGAGEWTARSAALPIGATAVRFVYTTDQVATGPGVLLDDIRVGDPATEGPENGIPSGWTATGWQASDGGATVSGPGLYVAERRELAGYDAALVNGPYLADPRNGSTAVDHFGYGGGVLVTFWDQRAPDNVVSSHPRSGRLLVVDARPEPLLSESGAVAPSGVHPFDAAFGTSWLRGFAVDGYTVTTAGEISAERIRVRARPPVPSFDDQDARYTRGTAGQPALPGVGVTLTVVDEGADHTAVRVGPSAR